jgi:trehalose 6-phosphate phosphatase
VPEKLSEQLLALSDRLEKRLALVSGRAIEDIERHLGPLKLARAGSHGIARRLHDDSTLGEEPKPLPQKVKAALRTFAQEHGFAFEEKPHGAALHYRSAPHLEARGLEFAQGLAELYELRTKRGKCVIELVHSGVDKGGALRAFMEVAPFHGATPIFIGDDVTDEDGFVAARALGGFGILVGEGRATDARYRLSDPAAVYDWLKL